MFLREDLEDDLEEIPLRMLPSIFMGRRWEDWWWRDSWMDDFTMESLSEKEENLENDEI